MEMRLIVYIISGLLLFDLHLHFPTRMRLNEQICLLQSLPLVTNHIDFRHDLTLILLIRPQDDGDKVRDGVSRLMAHLVLLLEVCSHPYILLTHYNIMIGLSKQPSHPFESEASDCRL